MGLTYASDESAAFIAAMTANIKSAKDIVSQLQKGLNHLIQKLSDGTLTGEAYSAGEQLFAGYVSPAVGKFSAIIEDMGSDLAVYVKADKEPASLGGVLDEDSLVKLIAANTKLKEQIDKMIVQYPFTIGSRAPLGPPLAGVTDSRSLSDLVNQSEMLGKIIASDQHELDVLRRFDKNVSGLFTDSATAMEDAMKLMSDIGNTGYDAETEQFSIPWDVESELSTLLDDSLSSRIGKGKGLDPSIAQDDPLMPGENAQGNYGDCYLLSQINALMETPEGRKQLRDGVRWDPSINGYDVHIHVYGVWEWVQVTSVASGGVRMSDRDGDGHPDGIGNGSGIGIAALYEAAVIQKLGIIGYLPGTGYTTMNGGAPNSYINIGDGIADDAVASGGSADGGTSVAATPPSQVWVHGEKDENGYLKMQATPDPSSVPTTQIVIVPNHVYEVVGMKKDAKGRTMIGLRNAWGLNNAADGAADNAAGVFYISQGDFNRAFAEESQTENTGMQ
jgi:hypothetical protein